MIPAVRLFWHSLFYDTYLQKWANVFSPKFCSISKPHKSQHLTKRTCFSTENNQLINIFNTWYRLGADWVPSCALIGKVMRIKLSVNLKQSSPYALKIRGMPEPNNSTSSTSRFSFVLPKLLLAYLNLSFYCNLLAFPANLIQGERRTK